MATETAAQNETLATATRKGTHWTQAELDQLRELFAKGQPDVLTAKQLHRSLYAVRSARRIGTELNERAVATPTLTLSERTETRYTGTTLEAMGF